MKNIDLEKVKKHFEAFWNKDYEERCNLALMVSDWSWCQNEKKDRAGEDFTNPGIAAERFRTIMRNTQYFGEALPISPLNFGCSGHVEFFGAQPRYSGDSIWFDPVLDAPDSSLLKIDEKAMERQYRFAKETVREANGEFFVGMPDNVGVIDGLAALRGSEKLLVDMLDDPDFIAEAVQKLMKVWKQSQEEFYSILRENNQGGSTHDWMSLWCPGRHSQLQCDFSVMISPDMYEKFVMPELAECVKFLDYSTYHLDGQEQIRHLDYLLSIKELDNIQWTPVEGQPRTSEFISVFKKFRMPVKGWF